MLAPSVEERAASRCVEAAIAASDFYPSFLDALRDRTGIEVPLDRQGSSSSRSDGESDRLRAGAPDGVDAGSTTARLRELEPAFDGHPGALLHPLDGAVDNVALMDALERAVDGVADASSASSAEVLSVDSDQPSALTRTRGRFFATRLVLATGAWAAGISGPAAARSPCGPCADSCSGWPSRPVRHVTYGGGGYLVPRGDTVLVGATSEEAGFENETSLAGLAALRNIAARAVPSLGAAVVVDHWAGLRPMSLDGHPILGPDPDSPALVYACGFSRNGILFAPWAAARLADVLVGDAGPRARALPRRPARRSRLARA